MLQKRNEYAVSLHHGENGSVFTLVRLFGADQAGWEPILSFRIGDTYKETTSKHDTGTRYRLEGVSAIGREPVIVPASGSTSFGFNANASDRRRPDRYMTVISARLRTPVGARFELARIRSLTSSAVRTSGGKVRSLLGARRPEW